MTDTTDTVEVGGTATDPSTDAAADVDPSAACELCRTNRYCVERHGLRACHDCHRELLPREGLF